MSESMMFLAAGRTADVFALDDGRVLRRYRNGDTTEAEAEIMAYVAGLGYPVPKVFSCDGPDMVLERVDGPTLAEALLDGRLPLADGLGLLADLHRRLHDLPARVSTDPSIRIVHLDLHPENVILTADGPCVIDWNNARDGRPDLDVALTALILAEVALDPDRDIAPLVAPMVAVFVAHAGGAPETMLAEAVAMRAANPTLSPQEKARLESAADLVRNLP